MAVFTVASYFLTINMSTSSKNSEERTEWSTITDRRLLFSFCLFIMDLDVYLSFDGLSLQSIFSGLKLPYNYCNWSLMYELSEIRTGLHLCIFLVLAAFGLLAYKYRTMITWILFLNLLVDQLDLTEMINFKYSCSFWHHFMVKNLKSHCIIFLSFSQNACLGLWVL